MTYTVLERNACLGTARYVGKFQTLQEADAYVEREAKGSRSFATFQVYAYTDSGRKPAGSEVKGAHK